MRASSNRAPIRIQIAAKGSGRLYYSVAATHYSNQARIEKQASISLNILRDYYRLVPTKTDDRIVYNLSPLDGPVSQGDVLAVRLTVTGSDWNYLLIEDPIPAGAEFIEKRQSLRNPGSAALVALLVHAPRAARRPYGDLSNAFRERAAAIFLSAESRQSRPVPSEPGAGPADVPARLPSDYRGEDARSTMTRSHVFSAPYT